MTLKSKKDWIRGSLITYGFTSKQASAVLSKLKYENQILQLFDYLKPYSKSKNRPSKEEINSEIQKISRRLIKAPPRTFTEHVFEAAQDHKFSAIKRHVDNGGDINLCDKYGRSLLTLFIASYNPEYTSEEKELLGEQPFETNMFMGTFAPKFWFIPLQERKSGIYKKLEYFFEHGADPNRCVMVDENTQTPLQFAVMKQDYYLTKYLLEHGADPTVCLSTERCERLESEVDYFLFSFLEARSVTNERDDRLITNWAISQLLWEHGLKGWSGTAIEIDPDIGVIHGEEAKRMLYEPS